MDLLVEILYGSLVGLFFVVCAFGFVFVSGMIIVFFEDWNRERKNRKEAEKIEKQVKEINRHRENLSNLVLTRK